MWPSICEPQMNYTVYYWKLYLVSLGWFIINIVSVYGCSDRFMVCNDTVDSLTEWLFGPWAEWLLGENLD